MILYLLEGTGDMCDMPRWGMHTVETRVVSPYFFFFLCLFYSFMTPTFVADRNAVLRRPVMPLWRHATDDESQPHSFPLMRTTRYPSFYSTVVPKKKQPRFSLLKTVDMQGLNLGAMGSTPDLLVTLFESCRHITTLHLWKTYVEVGFECSVRTLELFVILPTLKQFRGALSRVCYPKGKVILK